MARTLLRHGSETPKPDATKVLTGRVREHLGLGEDVTISIAEIACGEPACGGAETVILIMRPGCPTERINLKMPVAKVGERELVAALANNTSA